VIFTRHPLNAITTLPHRPFEPCIPSRTVIVPSSPIWLHEIKHDGFRLIVRREDDRVRLFTRNGYDWSDRYPLIVEAAKRLKPSSFVIDGEAVILRDDGFADFDALYSRKADAAVRLVAFDLLAVGGDDVRGEPLDARGARLTKLLAKSDGAMQLNPVMPGEIGPDLFNAACRMGLEGIVSKRRDRPYRAGRSASWLKVKNGKHPAMNRVMDPFT
jgi:bifunctional non-homologous end joining protein LigD